MVKKQKKSVLNRAIDFFFKSDYHTYLVGGYVRDNAMGIEPVDLDIVLEGDAIKAARQLNRNLKGDLQIYQVFGTATITVNNERIDLATARGEQYPNSARLPHVFPATIIHDLNRRDFTINAMAMSVSHHTFGEIFDPFNGLEDIRKGLIKVLHRNSFVDDPSRLLRAFRYKNRFDFKFEEKTRQFINEAVQIKLIDRLTGKRILNEINLIFDENDPGKIVRELSMYKFYPLSTKSIRIIERLSRDGRYYFVANIDYSKLPLSRSEKAIVQHFHKLDVIMKKLSKTQTKSSIFHILNDLEEPVRKAIVILQPKFELKFKIYRRLQKIKPFINGQDLKKIGLNEGPQFKKILSRIFDQQLDGKIKTRKQALDQIRLKA
ncbi:hypothetical protein A2Y85_05675 [candidate division WOR-3 bacterium RBG_13_43_14]|uniref:Poly A polymerase head domain-containing protein n=1 Tax=candidate division WOR-3 bacterium RBG_13_43_14 TaxID=1802590 RepID=A0A1F4UE99_UNCW3|nr:MAG: hypothetical protein A2Y85_05675 [candidate division WOR-3 bacterium RBG_13_43_14]